MTTGPDGWDNLPFRACVRVTSRRTPSRDITAALGVLPDYSHDIGDKSRLRPGYVYDWAEWQLRLAPADPAGVEGLSDALETLGEDLADRFARLSELTCDVVLTIVQEFDGEADAGLYLSSAAIRWLARTGAAIDVDQYVYRADDLSGG